MDLVTRYMTKVRFGIMATYILLIMTIYESTDIISSRMESRIGSSSVLVPYSLGSGPYCPNAGKLVLARNWLA